MPYGSAIKYLHYVNTSSCRWAHFENFIAINSYSAVFPTDRATCFPPPPPFRPNCNAAAGSESGARALRRRRPHLATTCRPVPPGSPWSATTGCTPHRLTCRASRSAASPPRAASSLARTTTMAGYASLKDSNLSPSMLRANLSKSLLTLLLKM